jgi:predicted nucleic acid-binding protein
VILSFSDVIPNRSYSLAKGASGAFIRRAIWLEENLNVKRELKFLDYLDRSAALVLINPDETLLRSAKAMIRRQAEQGYSFVDCLSFCLTSERKIAAALTTDAHFRKAGFKAVLV